MFFVTMIFFNCNAFSTNSLKCISMNKREYRMRPQIISINSNEPTFSPFSISVNKCSCSCYKVGCNNINDPYAQLYVPDVVKNINVKVFN